MQFDDFDNRIKDAADNHHPTYDEKAWDKMEALLDKHMPQPEKKRRRFFFFWLFALLLLGSGAAWLLLEKPGKKEESATAVASAGSEKNTDRTVTPGSTASAATENGTATTPVKDATTNSDKNADGSSVTTITTTDTDNKVVEPASAGSLSEQKRVVQPARIGLNKEAEQVITTSSSGIGKKKKNTKAAPVNDKSIVSANDPDKIADPVTMQKNETPSTNKTVEPATAVTESKPVNNTVEPATVSDEKKQEVNKPAEEKITAPVVPENNFVKEEAKKKKRANSFFFSLSAGPDVSAVGTSKIGKTRLLTGAGLGYTFNNRLTVRTGFYMTDKIYTAAPKDYKPEVPVPAAQYLTKIGADCKVYELPVSLTYNFSRSEKQGIFAGAAVSSLFMKKETYRYVYDYPGQPTYTYTKSYSNENKHFFSILTLSAGYQRKLTNFLSVAAEPYLKLPLTGVGHGKVKLSGGGVQFSLLVSPFAKAKPKTTGTK